MSYSLREHTADVAVEAQGPTLDAVFGAVADGLAAACLDPANVPGVGERFAVTATAEELDSLLYDYLGELIYQRDVRAVLPVDNDATVEGGDGDWRVTGTARGVPAAGLGAREVKAVTYSEMVLEPRDDGWYAYVVFDV
ncbi:MAG: archease [Halobacteriaceae archaeon]